MRLSFFGLEACVHQARCSLPRRGVPLLQKLQRSGCQIKVDFAKQAKKVGGA